MMIEPEEDLLRVSRAGPVIHSEWHTTDDLLAAVSAASSALVDAEGVPPQVRLAAALLVSAVSGGRVSARNYCPTCGRPTD